MSVLSISINSYADTRTGDVTEEWIKDVQKTVYVMDWEREQYKKKSEEYRKAAIVAGVLIPVAFIVGFTSAMGCYNIVKKSN